MKIYKDFDEAFAAMLQLMESTGVRYEIRHVDEFSETRVLIAVARS